MPQLGQIFTEIGTQHFLILGVVLFVIGTLGVPSSRTRGSRGSKASRWERGTPASGRSARLSTGARNCPSQASPR